MAYSRENKLRLIIDIQELYQLQKVHEGITDMWIWKTHIYPVYKISRRTLYIYLATPARNELKKLLDVKQSKSQAAAKQTALAFALDPDEGDFESSAG